jgi:hypothetical protein
MKRFVTSIVILIGFVLIEALSVGRSIDSLYFGLVLQGVGYFEINNAALVEIIVRLLPFFAFQMLCGANIYISVCDGGIYYLYRCPNRKKWLLKECSKLLIMCMIYVFIYFAIGTISIMILGKFSLDADAIRLIISSIIIYTFWLFLNCILINLFSFLKNSAAGIVIVVGIQTALITLLMFFSRGAVFDIYEGANTTFDKKLLQLNPITHIFIGLHSLSIEELTGYEALYGAGMSLAISAIVWIALAALAFVIFVAVFRNRDMIEERRD